MRLIPVLIPFVFVIVRCEDEATQPLNEQDFANADKFEDAVIDLTNDPLTSAGRFEGDIDLNGKALQDYQQEEGPEDPTRMRNAIRSPYKRWSSGRIPILVSAKFDPYERSRIAAAIKEYHKYTCVKFVSRDDERNYIYIQKGDGCYSLVGRHGGRQPLSLGRGCMAKGIIMHELMHAVGFFHEQSRADRDEYIDIDYSNVMFDAMDQFQKYSLRTIDHLGTPYDYNSIMHYGPYAFSRNRKKTVLPKQSGATIGQRRGFSRNDVVKINKLYECKKDHNQYTSSWTALKENQGVLIVPQKTACRDTRGDCRSFMHKCNTPKGRQYCSKTCGHCKVRRKPVNVNLACFDRFAVDTCEKLREGGHCKSGPLRSMSRRNCCHSCNMDPQLLL